METESRLSARWHSLVPAPQGDCKAVRVIVKTNRTWCVLLCEHYDLASVHGEVFNHVVDGSQHCGFTALNRDDATELPFIQYAQHRIGTLNRSIKFIDQLFRTRTVTTRKFEGAIAIYRNSRETANDPLIDVSGEVNNKITEAVVTLVVALPDSSWRNGSQSDTQLDRIFVRQVVSGAFYELRGHSRKLFEDWSEG